MDAALMGAIVIACCFVAGVFETNRKKNRNGNEQDKNGDRRKEAGHDRNS